ncbi:hypothetical protein OBV_12180 [Oscillibacter valericigenes Sjm18-20]|nr:hypothetical protein OBV_12180 [Oscillibacter valericigenes Sjm18-20]
MIADSMPQNSEKARLSMASATIASRAGYTLQKVKPQHPFRIVGLISALSFI